MTGNLSDAQIIYYYSVNVIDLWDGKLWNEYNCRTNKYFIFYIILSVYMINSYLMLKQNPFEFLAFYLCFQITEARDVICNNCF